jgi:putative ABC transport system permease protein
MKMYLVLLKESLFFALNALKTNKLRTFLSLIGVTIGIFSIIAVLAAVDSLDRQVKSDLSSLDKNTVYLLKYNFGPSDVPRWKRDQFPHVTIQEYEHIKKRVNGIEKVAFVLFVKPENVKYQEKVINSIKIQPCSNEFEYIEGIKVDKGRFFNESESNSGKAVAVIGRTIAETLFENANNAIGNTIRIYGQKFEVVGVMEKQGFSTFGESRDDAIYIPTNFIRRVYGDNNDAITPAITIKPVKDIDMDEFQGELIYHLRSFRNLKPTDDDNFAINLWSGLTNQIDEIFSGLNIAGWIISGFSLLVGGFGIANIMFVSVKERTNLIGIQKSLGAKNKFIMFQFLFESIILSLIGGLIGILMVWIITLILSQTVDFEFVLSFGNVVLGTSVSCIIGIISGIIPAINASKLDPVEAIRTGF